MKYPELRDAMDHDATELEAFSLVLVRELRMAADELESAFIREDTKGVGGVNHKLRTSLQLLSAQDLAGTLTAIVRDMREGHMPDDGTRRESVSRLRNLVDDLDRVRW